MWISSYRIGIMIIAELSCLIQGRTSGYKIRNAVQKFIDSSKAVVIELAVARHISDAEKSVCLKPPIVFIHAIDADLRGHKGTRRGWMRWPFGRQGSARGLEPNEQDLHNPSTLANIFSSKFNILDHSKLLEAVFTGVINECRFSESLNLGYRKSLWRLIQLAPPTPEELENSRGTWWRVGRSVSEVGLRIYSSRVKTHDWSVGEIVGKGISLEGRGKWAAVIWDAESLSHVMSLSWSIGVKCYDLLFDFYSKLAFCVQIVRLQTESEGYYDHFNTRSLPAT